jgi:hypothetical protein
MPGQGRATGFDPYQWGVRTAVKILSTTAGGLGAGILIGGPERFSSPGFVTARQVPGQHVTWGCMFLLTAGVAALGIAFGWRRRLVMVGLAAQAVGFTFLSTSLAVTAAHDPRTAYTGVVVYAGMAALCVATWNAGHALRPGPQTDGEPAGQPPQP